jgi:deoxyribodipyrimidine photo-lyase
MKPSAILWLRIDLRLADNPALLAAIRHGGAVIPVFIRAPDEENPWPPGGASDWWLHQSLGALDANFRELGSRIIFRRGPVLETLRALVKETGATGVFWNRRYEPAVIVRDAKIKDALRADGLKADSYNAALLFEPWTVKNKSERPFQVFTPFWKHCLTLDEPHEPCRAPDKIPAPEKWPKSLDLKELVLEPKIDWADGFRTAWKPGETGAQENLKTFLANTFADYGKKRNRPDLAGTSRLSPHFHFGEIGPCQVWHALKAFARKRALKPGQWHGSQFLAEVGWREFAHHLIFHFPRTTDEPLRREFEKFPWRDDKKLLRAWQKGLTGFPIVDAGMRELWTTGWMHNRVRMITASFLVKDLMLPWHAGAKWFWDTLVDADLAQNSLGWQWMAGCGADAAPYFRIFNPMTQGEKFDPSGDYIRRWCPELAKLPAEWIHEPHAAPIEALRAAGISLGKSYPEPVVNHAAARVDALAAFAKLKSPAR